MAEAQGSLIYQFLRRLLSQLGPREASAEVIKADEGTRTIKGEEDIAQFKAIIKRMMDETLRQRPQLQTQVSPVRSSAGQASVSQPAAVAEMKAPEDLEVSARELHEPEVPAHYGAQGYTAEDMRQRDAGQSFVEYLHKQGFMKPENLRYFQGAGIEEITETSPAMRQLYEVYQLEQDRERLER